MANEEKRGPGRPRGSKNKNSNTTNNPKSGKSSTSNKTAAGKSSASGSKSSAPEKTKQERIEEMQAQRIADKRVMDEIWSVILLAFGVFLIFTTQLNTTGAFGVAIHNFLRGLFGSMSVVLPYYFIICAVCLFFKKMQHINGRTTFFSILMFIAICMLNSVRFINIKDLKFSFRDFILYYFDGMDGKNGGAIGMELSSITAKLIGMPGLYILCITLIIICLLLVLNTPISDSISSFLDKRERKRLLKEIETVEAIQNEYNEPEAISESDPYYSEEIYKSKFSFLNPFRDDDDYILPSRRRPIVPASDVNNRAVKDTDTASDAEAKAKESVPEPMNSRKLVINNPMAETKESGTGSRKTSDSYPEPIENDKKEDIIKLVQEDDKYGISSKPSEEPKADTSRRFRDTGAVSYGLDGVSSVPAGSYGLDGHMIEGGATAAAGAGLTSGMPYIEDPVAEVKANAKPKADKSSKINIKTYDQNPLHERTATSHIDDYADLAAAANKLNESKPSNISDDNHAELAATANKLSEGKSANKPTKEDHLELAKEIEEGKAQAKKPYIFPSIDLLKKPKASQSMMSNVQLEDKANLLEKTLADFHVDAKVLAVTQGSSVTRFEVQPATGVKVSSITKLSDDIALNLRAKSIRIEAPIPGKAAVGIEIENEKAAPVLARELIESAEFRDAKSKITFVVGKDISGRNIVADLKAMPHMLIAGATGSGKSVCINTIITSILYKATPEEVRLILIDPKVVELGQYNGIPHMMIPVVTDPKKAAAALTWAVNEMTQRYKKFAEAGVKDLESYNELMVANHEEENKLPQIVIIIDELADLMMASPSQVEESICRLAQLARAAGMHLVVATQRPSVDIVTGLIKANIPSRIAFCVSSQFDSRTILDVGGAEKLLGKGDMLFSPVGKKPFRVQGPFISDMETSKIINFVKNQGEAIYDEGVQNAIESSGKGSSGGEMSDELTEDAIAFILKSQKVSVSMLQRRFRIGYNRAARIVDEIEDRGIITPQDGSSPRRVLYTEAEYYNSEDKE